MPILQARAPGVIKIAAWKEFSWLLAGFSTRQGGHSTAYCSGETTEQNLGWTPEDDPSIVAENRRQFLRAVAGRTKAEPLLELVTARQFHSGMVRLVERGTAPLSTPEGEAVLRGDGLLTQAPGLLLGIQTADCVPVLIADTRARAVAAFHAGWRGTLERIAERGAGTMRAAFGSRPEDLVAAIGPAIAACCFVVGEEVRDHFEAQFAYASGLFSEVYDGNGVDADSVRETYPLRSSTARPPEHSNLQPRIHLDLHKANRRQLLDAGLNANSISIVNECTACTRLRNGDRRYFSHRAEQGRTGRMLSVIGVAADR